MYGIGKCNKIKCFSVLLRAVMTVISCGLYSSCYLRSWPVKSLFYKPFLPFLHPQLSVSTLVFFFHAAFSVTGETQVTDKSIYDETAVTPVAWHRIGLPAFKRPVSKHIQKQIYNSSAAPLNLPCPSLALVS